jgi:class 3 adenylate cyclase/tetratricopeptide (TPR) repeat protein
MGRAGARDTGITSERRIITILAVDIVGSTRHIADCDPDDAQIFFDRCFDLMGHAIERAGGALVSFEGDGGIAAFGWPEALEDHADRACAAAWSLQHDRDPGSGPDGRPVRFRVGIHSGLVALRQLRRGGRSPLNTTGATVHIAAKLQQCAPPGGVLVSAEATRLCRSRLKLARETLPAALEGVSAFRLEAEPESARNDDLARRYGSPMIGRQAELAELRKSLPAPGGAGGAIALIGEPGVGKSRLAAAAVSDVRTPDSRILLFFGDTQKRTTPFAAARGLLADLLGATEKGQSEPLEARLCGAGLVSGEIAAVQHLISAPEAKRRRARLTDTELARLLATTLCALTIDRPTLILVEDLQLIDAESREFLRLLAAAAPSQPLCLLLTGRPESLRQAREMTPNVLMLEPLGRNAMKALGETLWPGGRTPGSTLERLLDRADGIPLVLEELIHSIESDGGGAHILPQGMESLIHARLDRLSPRAKALAQALSLLGENVDVALASEVIGLEAETLLEDLLELERFAFVHPLRGSSTHMRHQIIAEACADTIPLERRRQLHGSAVRAIVALHPSLDGLFEKLAFHSEGAGDPAAALGYLREAALEARRSSAIRSLSLIFDRAIGLIERIGEGADDDYVDFVLMAFAAMLQLGEFEKMNRHLPRVTAMARRMKKPELISSALSQLGMISWFEGRYEEGVRATEEGLALAHAVDSPALIFSNQFMLANNLHGLGRVRQAIALGRELCDMLSGELETARLGAATLPSATTLSFMSWFMMDVGEYEEGLEFAERGLEIALRAKDPFSEALARNGVAHNLMMLHRNSEAVDCLEAAREISERNGYDAIKANLAGRSAIALARSGRAGEAIAIVEDCVAKELHLRTGRLENYYLQAGYAEALFRGGETDRGLAVLDGALAIAREIGNPCLIASGLGLRARLLDAILPGDPRIGADYAERDEICARHGLTPWPAPDRKRL